ncbi:transcriptional regulator [Lentzea sp. NBRC 105346]|uniref:helix-turn-helix transcriptional regulator n=1 Tax=Lentzea sp. NBRC 105346 TaxID=3032205 RepID=UPI0024A33C21|nr:helix-turn-helix domain-containing protein [Lentzea sp. NBRC 105346]GLZ28239.1 transcriptional regulator [Lentzea sp. NBRC 105346]
MTSEDIRAVAALDDELRRGMYDYIRAERRPVTRDEAAAKVGISRKLAAFHLDKLVDAGLLKAGFEKCGRVGRAPKVYETRGEIAVTIPQRHHDVLADILLDAVAPDAAQQAAHARGEKLGAAQRKPGRLGPERALTAAQNILQQEGFEPHREAPHKLRLRNCPFHPLAAKAPALVCGINHAYLCGFLKGLGAEQVEAVLAPRPGECCVELRA